MSDKRGPQRWELSVGGHEHRVEVHDVGLSRELAWCVDGTEVARRRSSDDRVRLVPAEGSRLDLAVGVRCATFGGVHRVTLFSGEDSPEGSAATAATLGLGGLDLLPEPGSRAARREEMIRLHPRRHILLRTLGGVASVVVPLLLGLLAVRVTVALPWPSIPWPSIPWPSLPAPSIPWPSWSLPDWRLPGWLRWVLGHATYVWPVVLAVVLARSEVTRRRKQDALRRSAAAPAPSGQRDEPPRSGPPAEL